jgi:hypothetical protein
MAAITGGTGGCGVADAPEKRLGTLLARLGLESHLQRALVWYDEEGASSWEEVVENALDLAKCLGLGDAAAETVSAQTFLLEAERLEYTTLAPFARTASVQAAKQEPHRGGLCRVLTWQAPGNSKRGGKRGIERTCSCPDRPADRKPQICQVEENTKADAATIQSQLGKQKDGTISSSGRSGGLQRYPTQGYRDSLVKRVSESATHKSIDEGQTGNVYVLEVSGENFAIFKPGVGEKFSRSSLGRGQGYVREEAVYLIDRLNGSRSGVPVTSQATVEVDGKKLVGSVQAFVGDVAGFIEDFGVPRDPEAANEFIPKETAEALALLDMMIFNMDRHTGNLLLLSRQSPHGLGPIDHGCCLPPWWKLSEACFDAWLEWSHLKTPPCQATRAFAMQAAKRTGLICAHLEQVGIEAESIITFRLCTRVVSVGMELGVPCSQVAKLIKRDEETVFEKLSWLEKMVLECGCAARAQLEKHVNDRDIDELVIAESGLGDFDVEDFLSRLEQAVRAEFADSGSGS